MPVVNVLLVWWGCAIILVVLFRIEASILQGLTHPSCRSILAKGNVLKLKTKAEAVKLKGWVFTKPNHKKKATHDQKKNPVEIKKIFLLFLRCQKLKMNKQTMERESEITYLIPLDIQ